MQAALCASQAPLHGGTVCDVPPPKYPAFSALFFALDVTLPFFDLHQERFWAKNGGAVSIRGADLLGCFDAGGALRLPSAPSRRHRM